MRIDLEDDEGANLLEKLPAALAWLEAALRQKGKRVLVHCHAGGRGRGGPVQAGRRRQRGDGSSSSVLQ
jgi:protein-tyrosine phosphatase